MTLTICSTKLYSKVTPKRVNLSPKHHALMYLEKPASQFYVKYQNRFAAMWSGSIVFRFQRKSATQLRENRASWHIKRFVTPYQNKNARKYLVKCVKMCLKRNATMFQSKNAKLSPKRSVRKSLKLLVNLSRGKNA